MISKISVLLTGLYPAAIKARVTRMYGLRMITEAGLTYFRAVLDGAKFWLKVILTSVWGWISLSVLSDHVFTASWLDYIVWVSRVLFS